MHHLNTGFMRKEFPPLPKDFWATNRRLMKLGAGGALRFTEEGNREFRTAFGRHGILLETVTTLADFRRVCRDIAVFLQETARPVLEARLKEPGLSQWERTATITALRHRMPATVDRPAQASNVVQLATWRTARAA